MDSQVTAGVFPQGITDFNTGTPDVLSAKMEHIPSSVSFARLPPGSRVSVRVTAGKLTGVFRGQDYGVAEFGTGAGVQVSFSLPFSSFPPLLPSFPPFNSLSLILCISLLPLPSSPLSSPGSRVPKAFVKSFDGSSQFLLRKHLCLLRFSVRPLASRKESPA